MHNSVVWVRMWKQFVGVRVQRGINHLCSDGYKVYEWRWCQLLYSAEWGGYSLTLCGCNAIRDLLMF